MGKAVFLSPCHSLPCLHLGVVAQLYQFLPSGNATGAQEFPRIGKATIEQLGLLLKHRYRDNEIDDGFPSNGTSMKFRLDNRISTILLGLLLVAIAIASFGAIASPAWANDYNKEFLIGVDFSGKELTDSSFTKANLRSSNLSHTNLRGVSFFGANLESVDLEGADLRNATLDTARLTKANLKNAVLEGAFAFNTKFEGAIIDGADFTDVLLRQDVQKQLCKVASGTNPTTGRETRETLFCP
jgi:hypothetical protein